MSLLPGGSRKPFKIVRHVTVDDDTLKRIAELLGIPEAERDRIISGEIHIGPPSTPASGSPPPMPPSGGAPPPSPPRRGRR
jgi:hypothetical protein